MTEIEKYHGIYSHPAYAFYGHSNHGARAVETVQALVRKHGGPVLDVGCGWNEFARHLRDDLGVEASGVDFACPGADVVAPAHQLPVSNKSVGVLTSFDMLEHLEPSEIPVVLAEFARVSAAFVFSISYQPSRVKWKGETLHPSVFPEEWWINQIIAAGGGDLEKVGPYIMGKWSLQPLKLDRSTRVVLVGNGPSVLTASNGPTIDQFDEVVRFNRYQKTGFEQHVGSKTTIWSTFGHGYLPGDKERPPRILFVHGERGEPAYEPEALWRIPRYFSKAVAARVKSASKRPPQELARLNGASSGIVVALYLLDVVGVDCVHLAGFDHFQKALSWQHHYYNPKAYGRPPEMEGDAEGSILAGYEAAGRVIYLPTGEPLTRR
jgi:hypothetical protein